MKRAIKSLSILIAVMIAIGSTAMATFEDESFNMVNAKQSLAAEHVDEYIPMSEAEAKAATETKQVLLCQLIASGVAQDVIDKEMESLGVYRLDTPDNSITPKSTTTDVLMNQVNIYYDAYTTQWIVSGGGYWVNDSWISDLSSILWIPGNVRNVGNRDSVGIAFYNTSGTYNTQVMSSVGVANNMEGDWDIRMNNPSHGDGMNGVAFEFQDQIRYDLNNHFSYLGKGFAASIAYSAGFSNYNGYARTFYVHTWNSAYISDIGFGVSGKQFGVDVNITNSQNSFKIFNNSDTVF